MASRGAITVSGLTDNAGNESVLGRLMTSKFPLVVILTELSEQLRHRHLDLALRWIPRGQNEEADALTNQDFSSFRPSNRVDLDVSKLPFRIIPSMVKVAENLYAYVQKKKGRNSGKDWQPKKKVRPEDKLRSKAPW